MHVEKPKDNKWHVLETINEPQKSILGPTEIKNLNEA